MTRQCTRNDALRGSTKRAAVLLAALLLLLAHTAQAAQDAVVNDAPGQLVAFMYGRSKPEYKTGLGVRGAQKSAPKQQEAQPEAQAAQAAPQASGKVVSVDAYGRPMVQTPNQASALPAAFQPGYAQPGAAQPAYAQPGSAQQIYSQPGASMPVTARQGAQRAKNGAQAKLSVPMPGQAPANARPVLRGKKVGHDLGKIPDSPPEWKQGSLLPPAPGPRTSQNEKNAISPTIQPFSPYSPNAAQQIGQPQLPQAPKAGLHPVQAPQAAGQMTGQRRQQQPQANTIHGLDRFTQPKQGIKAPKAKDTGKAVPLRPLRPAQGEAVKNGANSYGVVPTVQ